MAASVCCGHRRRGRGVSAQGAGLWEPRGALSRGNHPVRTQVAPPPDHWPPRTRVGRGRCWACGFHRTPFTNEGLSGAGGGAREGTGPSSRQLLTPGHRAAFPTTREFLELEQGAPHGTETPTGKKYALALLSREARILRVVREPSFRPGPPRRFHFPEFVSSLSLGPAVPGSSDRGLSALICCLVALPLRFPPSAHNPVLSTSVFTPRTAQESGRRCGAGGARRSPSRGICLMPAEY